MHPKCIVIKNEKLIELAKYFQPYAILYVVGGYSRNMIMDIEQDDIDICSRLQVEDVRRILKDTSFSVLDRNLRVGTVYIVVGKQKFEYTTFRVDNYNIESGVHRPESVVFTEDIELDARRRDFKMNAIYYDVLADKFEDFLGGIQDIENRVISTVNDPEQVFQEDGLRLMRLARFSAQLGFGIEIETFTQARKNAWRIKDIKGERIAQELNSIIESENKYARIWSDVGYTNGGGLTNFCNNFEISTILKGKMHPHLMGLAVLIETGVLNYIIPELFELKGLVQNEKYHDYDAFYHSLQAFNVASEKYRLVALLHDIGKAPSIKKHSNSYYHAGLGSKIAEDILNRLKYPKAYIRWVSRLIENHMVDINNNMSEKKLLEFILQNIDIVEDLIELKKFDKLAAKGVYNKTSLSILYDDLIEKKMPLKISQLKVNGKHLLEFGVNGRFIAEILKNLLFEIVSNRVENNFESQYEYIGIQANKFAVK